MGLVYAINGQPFHGEFTSADASALSEANSRFGLYVPFTLTTIPLVSTDRVVITDVWFWSVAAVAVSVYDGSDTTVSAGEKIWGTATVTANTNVWQTLATPHHCQTGTYPKVKTGGAGQIDAIIRGFIVSP